MTPQQTPIGWDATGKPLYDAPKPTTAKAPVGWDASGAPVYEDAPPPAAPTPSGGLGQTYRDLGTGLVKSVMGLGESLVRSNPVVAATEMITGQPVNFGTGIDNQPSNPAQRTGKAVGDVATAMLPGGLITRGAKAAAAVAPKITRPLVRGAVEAIGAGTTAAATGGDPTTAAVVGGTLGTVAGGAQRLSEGLKKSADASMIAAMGPAGRGSGPAGTATLELAKKVAPDLIKRGFKATSHEDALRKVGEILDVAAAKVDDRMAALPPGTRVQSQPLLDFLGSVKRQNQINGTAVGTGKIINDVIDTVVADIKDIGPSMTPEQIVSFKQKIGPLAKFSQLASSTDNTKAEGYQIVYNGLRESMDAVDQGINVGNKEVSFWLKVQDILEKANRRPQAPSSGTSGAILGGITGTSAGPMGVLTAAYAGRQLQRLMRSPGWRFYSANVKDAIADAIASRDAGKFNQLIAQLSAQAVGGGQE